MDPNYPARSKRGEARKKAPAESWQSPPKGGGKEEILSKRPEDRRSFQEDGSSAALMRCYNR